MLPTIGKLARLAGTAAALIAISTQAQALTFTYNFTAGTSAAAQNAFIDAGARWSAVFSDNVNVILTVGTAALNPGVLAQAGSTRNVTSYAVFRNQVVFDATTATDATAVANLQTGPNLNVLINGTADNPNGAGSLTPYLDNTGPNTSTINLTTANAKALGFTPTLGTVGGRCIGLCDAFIQFSTNFAFDTNPNDGITAGEFDFVGIATHEIGHALGFVSGVDVLDGNISPNGPFPDNAFTFISPLDVFRFSTASTAAGAIDFTAGTGAKYFSVDGGQTVGAGFSTGSAKGDGRQASHFKDNLGLGIMDPTAGRGELLAISGNDLLAFDAIGWNLNLGAVPEPATWGMMIVGFGLIGSAMRRKTKVSVSYA
jgi:hypothetical protein